MKYICILEILQEIFSGALLQYIFCLFSLELGELVKLSGSFENHPFGLAG